MPRIPPTHISYARSIPPSPYASPRAPAQPRRRANRSAPSWSTADAAAPASPLPPRSSAPIANAFNVREASATASQLGRSGGRAAPAEERPRPAPSMSEHARDADGEDSDAGDINLYDFGAGAALSDSEEEEEEDRGGAGPGPAGAARGARGPAGGEAAAFVSRPLDDKRSPRRRGRPGPVAPAEVEDEVIVLDSEEEGEEDDAKRARLGGEDDEDDEDALLRSFDIVGSEPAGGAGAAAASVAPKLMEMKRKHVWNSRVIELSRPTDGFDADGEPVADDAREDDGPASASASAPAPARTTSGRRLQHSVLENARMLLGAVEEEHVEEEGEGDGGAGSGEERRADGIVVQVRFKRVGKGNTGGSETLKKVRINPNEPISSFMQKFRKYVARRPACARAPLVVVALTRIPHRLPCRYALRERLVASEEEGERILFQADGEKLNSAPGSTAEDLDIEEGDLVDASVR